MRMLHNEARELAVEAYKATHDAKAVARDFQISKWTVYHMAERKRATGSVALRLHNRGRKSVVSPKERQQIRESIEKQPDLTLAEIKEKLQLSASIATIQRVVVALGFRIKKKSLHASEQERPRCAEQTYPMERINDSRHGQSPRLS